MSHDKDRDLFDRSARDLLDRNGIDIGDVVAVVIQGGPTITGTLVAVFDRVIRVVTTLAINAAIPVGTVLTIDVDDIAAIGRVTA